MHVLNLQIDQKLTGFISLRTFKSKLRTFPQHVLVLVFRNLLAYVQYILSIYCGCVSSVLNLQMCHLQLCFACLGLVSLAKEVLNLNGIYLVK